MYVRGPSDLNSLNIGLLRNTERLRRHPDRESRIHQVPSPSFRNLYLLLQRSYAVATGIFQALRQLVLITDAAFESLMPACELYQADEEQLVHGILPLSISSSSSSIGPLLSHFVTLHVINRNQLFIHLNFRYLNLFVSKIRRISFVLGRFRKLEAASISEN